MKQYNWRDIILLNKIRNYINKYIAKSKQKNEFDNVYSFVVNKKNPVIFDVGANAGQSIVRYKRLFPNSIIHSFEPLENEYNNLLLKYKNDNSVIINNFALGEKIEKKDFYISVIRTNSSFQKTKSKAAEFYLENFMKTNKIDPKTEYVTKIKKVEVQTLDSYCERNNINTVDILKIDTPGHEDKVIAGCTNLLSVKTGINIIETDIIFDKVFERSISFFDIEQYIIKNNFKMIALKPTRFKNVFEGYKFSAAIVYQNKRFIE